MTERFIYTLLKMGREHHLSDFRAGRLYMNQISFFKDYKNAEGEYRGDILEGMVGHFQPDKLGSMKLGEEVIPIGPHNLAGPILLHSNEVLGWNAFCMYAVHSGPFTSLSRENFDGFVQWLRVEAKNLGLGDKLVFITNGEEFRRRFVAAAIRGQMPLQAGLVEYFDPATFDGYVPRPGFYKSDVYGHQREFRIIRATPSDGPYVFDIGPIDDISEMTTLDEFNRTLRVSLPDEPATEGT